MKNYNINNYTYGSLAYKEQYRYEEKNNYDIKIEKTRGLSKKKPVFVAPVIMCTALVAAAVVALLAQYTAISYTRKLIDNKKAEIKTLEDEIYNVDVTIAEALDLANIKKEAIGRLGMQSPSDAQVRYVSVPNTNYTVNY